MSQSGHSSPSKKKKNSLLLSALPKKGPNSGQVFISIYSQVAPDTTACGNVHWALKLVLTHPPSGSGWAIACRWLVSSIMFWYFLILLPEDKLILKSRDRISCADTLAINLSKIASLAQFHCISVLEFCLIDRHSVSPKGKGSDPWSSAWNVDANPKCQLFSVLC